MEHWRRWHPYPKIEQELRLKKELMNQNKFVLYGELYSSSVKDNKYIKIDYTNSLLSYRETDEGKLFQTYDYLNKNYCEEFYNNWNFFKIENSNYIKWFLDECLVEPPIENIEHHVIFTEQAVDILCIKKPEITISDTPII